MKRMEEIIKQMEEGENQLFESANGNAKKIADDEDDVFDDEKMMRKFEIMKYGHEIKKKTEQKNIYKRDKSINFTTTESDLNDLYESSVFIRKETGKQPENQKNLQNVEKNPNSSLIRFPTFSAKVTSLNLQVYTLELRTRSH